uniref:ATRAD54 (ARABIDOPSIS HOMOLOG OF RAD54) n=1 Tax=Arundo donax TaxID=35708 RepID=A0A0A9GF77_ARUDO
MRRSQLPGLSNFEECMRKVS